MRISVPTFGDVLRVFGLVTVISRIGVARVIGVESSSSIRHGRSVVNGGGAFRCVEFRVAFVVVVGDARILLGCWGDVGGEIVDVAQAE